MNTDENQREVVGGIASVLSEQMTAKMPIPLGDSSYAIVQMGYLDGDPEIWLRTNADDVWIVRVHRLGTNLQHDWRADHQSVIQSFLRYEALVNRKDDAMRVATSCDVPADMALQAFYDEVLSDDERECWNRWSPGGYATKQELEIIKASRHDRS